MIIPTRGHVLIEAEKAEEKTASGFYVPDSAQEKPQKGVVVAVGDASARSETLGWMLDDVKVGDRVIYKRWGGEMIKDDDGKEYQIARFEDILAVIK